MKPHLPRSASDQVIEGASCSLVYLVRALDQVGEKTRCLLTYQVDVKARCLHFYLVHQPRDQVEFKARCLHFYLVLHLVAWPLKSRVS